MKKLYVLVLLSILVIGCHKTAPQRPTYHTQQSGVAVLQEDSGLIKIIRYNEEQVDYANHFLAQWVVLDKRKWVLDEQSYWYLITEKGTGDTVKIEEERQIHLITRHLDGTLIADEEKIITVGKREVIVAVDDDLLHRRVGDKLEMLVPWYLAYGQFGNEDAEPYENIYIQLTILQ